MDLKKTHNLNSKEVIATVWHCWIISESNICQWSKFRGRKILVMSFWCFWVPQDHLSAPYYSIFGYSWTSKIVEFPLIDSSFDLISLNQTHVEHQSTQNHFDKRVDTSQQPLSALGILSSRLLCSDELRFLVYTVESSGFRYRIPNTRTLTRDVRWFSSFPSS